MRTLLLLFVIVGQLVSAGGATSPLVRKALGGTPEQRAAQDRFAALAQLGDQLGQEDRRAILDYLEKTVEPPEDFTDAQWFAYVNDLMALLVRQRGDRETRLAFFLDEVFSDTERHAVLRDYALQHLADWIRRHGDAARGIDTLTKAASAVDTAYSGTALLALRRVREEQPYLVQEDRLAELALTALRSEDAAPGTRATALAFALESTRKTEALEWVRPWVFDPAQPLQVRIAVIAALARSGDTAALEKLQEAEPENPWIQDAVRTALARHTDAP